MNERTNSERLGRLLPESLMLPAETHCGRGLITSLLSRMSRYGSRGTLIHGHSLATSGTRDRILSEQPTSMDVATWEHEGGEPTLDQVSRLRETLRAHASQWVTAVGGGSVLDLAKAAAGLINEPDTVEAYHDGHPFEQPGIPLVASPTTAGTGSEATVVSVLTNTKTGVKKSIRHPSFAPVQVILDASLLASCPPSVIAHSGMDALTQAVEAYTSRHAVWLSDTLALKAVEQIASNLETVHGDPSHPVAEALLLGSYLAGLALSFARLGVVHGLAHPLGARLHIPHGQLCGACLPTAITFNRAAMGSKYDSLSKTLGTDLLTESKRLLQALGVASPFSDHRLSDRDAVIREVLASGSTAANPRPVTAKDAEQLLDTLFHST